MTWTVNADGALTITDSNSAALVWAYGTDRWPVFVLNGGSFTVNDSVDLLRNSTAAGNAFVDFQAPGSRFTANFGTDFSNLSAVQARIGAGLTFRDSLADPNFFLDAIDNQNGTFSVEFQSLAVTVIPEPSSALLVCLVGAMGFLHRRR